MPDCSKGRKSRNLSRSRQPVAGGSRSNGDRCRHCDIMEARLAGIESATRTLRETKRKLRKKYRELRHKLQKMNLIVLTIVDICETSYDEDNIALANTICSLVDSYREESSEFDSSLDEDE